MASSPARSPLPSFAGAASSWRRGVGGVGMAVDFGSGEGMAELGHVGIGLRAAAAPAVRPSLFFFSAAPL